MSKQLLEQFPRPNLVQRFQPPQDGAAPSGANGGAANSPEPALNPAGRPSLVADPQLINLARRMGREWRRIGVQFLGLPNHRLEQLEEKHQGDLVMQAFGVLLQWRKKEGKAATAARLHSILSAQDVALQLEALNCLLEPGQG